MLLFQITESQHSEDGGAMVLLSDTYDEYTFPAAAAMDINAEDLPITLKLTHTNYTVHCIELLVEETAVIFNKLL